tara:strand:+ start:353 stop:502 length:150 start_codon:yes stop_codon:yes gene_type:complete
MTTKTIHSHIHGFITYKMTKGKCKLIYQERNYLEKSYSNKILGVQTPTV